MTSTTEKVLLSARLFISPMKTISTSFFRPALTAVLLANSGLSQSAAPTAAKPAMATPVQVDNLDPAAFAEWVDGQETPISGADKSQTPQWLIWTNKSQPGHSGLTFGESKTPGARHLRIDFKNAVAPGSVLVRGGGQLSALKTGAAYPGDLSSEADWIPAQRLDKSEVSAAVKGQPKAVLYRAVVPGTKEPVPFSSPWRMITLDRADDVSAQIQLAGAGGNYELSIPLAALGLKPKAGQSLKGDIGILRGNGTETTARVYWSNKATGITSDVPSEAMLTPLLWGRIEMKAAP